VPKLPLLQPFISDSICGPCLQTKVQNALKNLEEYCTWMRVLGSYPVGI
jgi:prephenate dehydratase